MRRINTKTVVEFAYESEEEARNHEMQMTSDGWSLHNNKSYFIKHFRSYSKAHREGSFL